MKVWKWIVVCGGVLLLLAGLTKFWLQRFHQEDEGTSWKYRSPEHGFTVTLPSRDWEEIKRPKATVAFVNRKHRTLVEVNAGKESREDFLKFSLPAMKKHVADSQAEGELIGEPQIREGESKEGNLYWHCTTLAKGGPGETVFSALSIVWRKDNQVAVRVNLEGQLQMSSQTGQASERAFFENAAKVICRGIE
jgi:hypothetical protein